MRELHVALFLGVTVVLLSLWQLPYHAVSAGYAATWGSCNCSWVEWQSWSVCNRSCFGTRERERQVWIFFYDGCDSFSDCATSDMAYSYSGCNEVCHNGGSSTGSGCNCVAGYYGNCCDYQINCGYPGTLSNGHVSGSVYTYAASVGYSCDTHYTLVDGSSTRTCQLSGTWSGTQPRCAFSNTCSSNPCANGGTCTNGIEMFTCSCLPGWSGITCAEDVQPPVITGCDFNIRANATTPLHFVNWTAPTVSDPMGHEIEVSTNYPTSEYEFPWGDFVIHYAAVKPFNGLTAECTIQVEVRPTPCEDLPVPDNGAVVCNDWRTDYGRYCQVVCHTGYSLPVSVNPDQWYVCGASGTWAPVTQDPLTCRSYTLSSQNTTSVNNCTDTGFISTTKTAFIDNLKSSAFSDVCNDYSDLCNTNNAFVMC
ncbi:sushi, von Willebrand factor type A, EGF and pentraxin domain-containing protein 1-like [Pecten maximus]|uniref:sushi, von Willebrand factor type A, EGF and pentraxin domain-containing protein 1-like n=1 Tax=Pecten maximus TaxID=6579 RepID=UPI0014586230|nr:sushi, von Willebrand factor type A, EGF and pentraxin domain-containing protein 1-like [Pecten maximus]